MPKAVIVARSGCECSILLLGLMVGLVGMPLVWSVPPEVSQAFTGTDSKAVALITTLAPDYLPWVEVLWQPGLEVEAFLFALQAALGAGGVGYYLGRRRGTLGISRRGRMTSSVPGESFTDASS